MARSVQQLLVVVLLLCCTWCVVVRGVDIPSTSIPGNNWVYFSLDLATLPAWQTTQSRAIIFFSISEGTSNVQLKAQYNTQPTLTSNTAINQTDSADGQYFGAVKLSQTTGSIIFGVFNGGTTGVTISGGRYYFAEEQALPDPFSLDSLDHTIKAGTATIFVLSVPEATSLALSFSLKFTDLNAFKTEIDNLLLRLDAIPSHVDSDRWGVIDYEPDAGLNDQGKKVAGWEGWFRKGILSGQYYIPLYNSEAVDRLVTVRAYLTQIFDIKHGVPVKVTAKAEKKVVLTYLTDPSTANNRLQVVTSTASGANTPSVQIQKNVCPTLRRFQGWDSTRTNNNAVTYTTTSLPVTSYCIVVLNTATSGSYDVTLTASQKSSSTNTNTAVTVTNDEYGDGVESIEVAGIVIGVFIGIFSLIFIAWFLLILLQADRDAWFDADPLTHGASDNQL